MRGRNGDRPAPEGTGQPGIGAETDQRHTLSDPPRTQLDVVLAMLLDRPAVCGSEFLDARIPRYSAHIHTLRKQGYHIDTRICDLGHYHESQAWCFELVALPAPSGAASGTRPVTSRDSATDDSRATSRDTDRNALRNGVTADREPWPW